MSHGENSGAAAGSPAVLVVLAMVSIVLAIVSGRHALVEIFPGVVGRSRSRCIDNCWRQSVVDDRRGWRRVHYGGPPVRTPPGVGQRPPAAESLGVPAETRGRSSRHG